MEETGKLPESVSLIEVNGKEIYLVGTAHISRESVDDVRNTIQMVKPDSVCIELCEPRFKAMTERDNWKNMNIFKIIRQKKSTFLLAQLILSSFYKQLGEKLGIQPGAEMLEAINQASSINAKVVLADREVEITLKRVWRYLGFWSKMKMMSQFLAGIMFGEEIDESMIEEMKKRDQLEAVLAEFADKYPEVKRRLLDERDVYLAQKIRHAPGEKIVAVVGAGHVEGIKKSIQSEQSLDELIKIPPKSIVPTIIKWLIPVSIIALVVWGFFSKGATHSVENIWIWILVNGILSAIGTMIAFGHPLSIITAFIAAPFTSLNPALAAGWFAGLVEALIRKPTVDDFEDLAEATSTIKGFWKNHVTRILLVVVLANLGSVFGTWIAYGWIVQRLAS